MSNLAIIATIDFLPGRRDELLPLLVAHLDRCLRDEPETLRFELLIPRDDDTKVLLHEVYRDDAAFELHRNSPSIARWREESAGTIAAVHVTRCSPVA